MHDFLLTDDERRLRAEVRSFFGTALEPRARASERDAAWEPLREAVTLTASGLPVVPSAGAVRASGRRPGLVGATIVSEEAAAV